MSNKPSLPRGMRDFGPEKMAKRNFIFNTIKSVFSKYGFMQIETPAMENLSVLTGKYGDEGDQLLYKVLNSGDFLSKSSIDDFNSGSNKLTQKISNKGLKYDLTVPFARFVVMNRNDVTLPFKRFQIQPVWRADKPQKGRYREFYQCDADVVGTESLLCETEIILMINEVFDRLGITEFTIKMNSRKVLKGIVEAIGAGENETDFLVAIDKLDKIGLDKVKEELSSRGLDANMISMAEDFLSIKGTNSEVIEALSNLLSSSEIGMEGISELNKIQEFLEPFGLRNTHIEIDPTLARGLSYYTGAIFEVKTNNVKMGSVSGGGRYDDLTGVFGMPDISGVGFSFGVDRIYDVMDELDLFPEEVTTTTNVLIAHFDEESRQYGLSALGKIRNEGISCEIYPDIAKIKKQFNYADKKGIPYVIVIGSDEINSGLLKLKDLTTGEETKGDIESLIQKMLD
ncbi:MAG: histidine--tRNA ligase [Bacteroidota bacterium]